MLPIFALVLFAMVDFGLALQSFLGLRNGVNTGAREASVSLIDPSCSSTPNPMICTVQNRIGNLLGVQPGSVLVAITFPSGSSGTSGGYVVVHAQATLKSITGLTAPFLSGKVICTSSQIRLEQDARYTAGSTGTVSC